MHRAAGRLDFKRHRCRLGLGLLQPGKRPIEVGRAGRSGELEGASRPGRGGR
jgi:hypothetical protein